MSKIIYVCSATGDFNGDIEAKLFEICQSLQPSNLTKNPGHRVYSDKSIAYGVTMAESHEEELSSSYCLGKLHGATSNLWDTNLVGNYAVFRSSKARLEVMTDATSSRSIWYYHDSKVFVAATSQRAIISYLGSFVFNKKVVPWMLSAGSLGPSLSWDSRISLLPPGARLMLDKNNWSVSITIKPTEFRNSNQTEEEYISLLDKSIGKSVIGLAEANILKWTLPISGGADSRAILCYLVKNKLIADNLQTITWGTDAAISQRGNDAKIAKELATALGVSHKYLSSFSETRDLKEKVDRFLQCGEGRIDHLSGYMDGMKIWRDLFESGVVGVIRGDEGFGWDEVSSELTVKLSVGCALCSDFDDLRDLESKYGLGPQEMPSGLKRIPGESLETWRDRLYHCYRLPIVLSALSDIKLAYVEEANPLIVEGVLDCVRTMPDSMRTNKRLFRRLVDRISPNISFATIGANASMAKVFETESFAEMVLEELESAGAQALLGRDFADYVITEISNRKRRGPSRFWIEIAKKAVPAWAKNHLKDNYVRKTVGADKLAFRVYIISRMNEILSEDARRIR